MGLAKDVINLTESEKNTHCPGCGKKFDEPRDKDEFCYDCFTEPAKMKMVKSRYGHRFIVIKDKK
jgi:protein-arginine kinase activator protein McsA